MAHILVTGASGFIGSNLVETLIAGGDQVTCLARPTSSTTAIQKLGAGIAIGDVTEAASLPSAVANVDTVYHLAGLTKANSRPKFYACNEQGVRNVVDACARRTT
jgi:nucleoside-diphosphate-sugar epimerase